MTALQSIIDRLAKATGPDRVIDAMLHEVVIGPLPLETATAMQAPKPYTASTDAALSLVPEGFFIFEMGQSGRDLAHGYYVNMAGKNGRYFGEGAKTLPLAICIAAIRARAAQKERSSE